MGFCYSHYGTCYVTRYAIKIGIKQLEQSDGLIWTSSSSACKGLLPWIWGLVCMPRTRFLSCAHYFSAMDSKVHLEIVGLMKDQSFHVAKSISEVNLSFVVSLFRCSVVTFHLNVHNTVDFAHQGLKQKFPKAFLDPKIQPLFEFDWYTYQYNIKRVSHHTCFRTLIINPNPFYYPSQSCCQ